MDSLENAFLFLDYLTDTKRKRHMVGGAVQIRRLSALSFSNVSRSLLAA